MKTRPPVLVIKLYYHGGLGTVRSLGRLGARVHAVHDDRRAPAARSRYLREVLHWDFARSSEDDTLEFLLSVGRRLGNGTVLVAADDSAEAFVAAHADALRDIFVFPRQPPGLSARLYSKRGLHELCRDHGVPTPASVFPRGFEEARELLRSASYPIVLKPDDKMRFQARTDLAMHIAHDPEDAIAAYERLEDPAAPNLLVQEHIPSSDVSMWVFTGYFDQHSQLLFGAGGLKLRQYPVQTGTTCYGPVRSNPELEAATVRFAQALGYRGVFDCGYRYDPRDGRYKLLDVNPRVGANFRQCVGRDGMDVVQAMYLDLCGEPVPADPPAEGRTWWVENYDLAAFLELRRLGQSSVRRWVRSLRSVDEPAWFARDDLAPFAATCVRSARSLAVRRFGGTRRDAPGAAPRPCPVPEPGAAKPAASALAATGSGSARRSATPPSWRLRK